MLLKSGANCQIRLIEARKLTHGAVRGETGKGRMPASVPYFTHKGN